MGLCVALFSKRSSGDSKGSGSFQRDPRKARRFFEHAQAVADASNHDYAIECYVNGLRHDPDNMAKHEALRDVSLRRKVAGGKPAGFAEKLKSGGSDPIDKMLHAEKLWAMDPLNIKHMRDVMRHAVEADEQEHDLHMGEVAFWVGSMIIDMNVQTKKPDKSIYIEVRDLFARVGAWAKAVEACKRAIQLSPNDDNLLASLKDLEAERTMQEGGYNRNQGDEGEDQSFRRSVRDADKQRALEQEDGVHKTASAQDEIVARARAGFEEDPQDMDRLQKLVDALLQKEQDDSEKEAITLLKQAWDQTGQYRYKVRIGDIQMKQLNRKLRHLKARIEKDPDNDELKHQYEELRRKRLAFELQEYTERTKNYPTDLPLRFELGKRLYQAKQFDEAIGAFQQAKSDPKHRAASHMYLGSCYLAKQWYDEAIDTLREGIEKYQSTDDRLAMDLRYLLMDALEQVARKNSSLDQAQEAQKISSAILQTNINYRDIRQRMEAIRELVNTIQQSSAD